MGPWSDRGWRQNKRTMWDQITQTAAGGYGYGTGMGDKRMEVRCGAEGRVKSFRVLCGLETRTAAFRSPRGSA